MFKYKFIAATTVLALTVGCAADDPHRRAKAGAAIGAVTGAVLGHQTNSKNGKVVGAAVGAIAGAAVGNYMDKQQAKLSRQLAAEQRNDEVGMTRIDEDTIRLDVSSEASFDVNSSTVQAGFMQSLSKMSSVISEYESTAVHIIGHTDSSGSESYNQALSVKRANAVNSVFARRGVVRSRIRTGGRGESMPTASNSTSAGRSANRRVEIYLKAIVKGRESEAFQPPI